MHKVMGTVISTFNPSVLDVYHYSFGYMLM